MGATEDRACRTQALLDSTDGRALAHVQEWRELYKSELLEDWLLASERKPGNVWC
jgi:hypothetical protein